jgi:hypothetical protein
LSRGGGGGGDRDNKDWTEAVRNNADGIVINPDNGNGRPP